MIVGPLLAVVVLVGAMWAGQRRLIYFPGRNVPPVDSVLPGWSAEMLRTDDGLSLGAWYLPPPDDAPVVIVFNGNAGTRADRSVLGAGLAERGFGVLLMDYRGYGSNPGSPSEEGLALDARAAHRFVDDRAAGHSIVYFGESLGAGVAVELAVEHPPAALVLRSPFTSLADVASHHYPFLPVRVLLQDEFRSAERIGHVDAPVLVIAGSTDSIVPTAQSETIHELAREPKQLLIVPGADHNDFELAVGPAMLSAVEAFVRQATP